MLYRGRRPNERSTVTVLTFVHDPYRPSRRAPAAASFVAIADPDGARTDWDTGAGEHRAGSAEADGRRAERTIGHAGRADAAARRAGAAGVAGPACVVGLVLGQG